MIPIEVIIVRNGKDKYAAFTEYDFERFNPVGAGNTPEEAKISFLEVLNELSKETGEIVEISPIWLYDYDSIIAEVMPYITKDSLLSEIKKETKLLKEYEFIQIKNTLKSFYLDFSSNILAL